MSMSSTYVGKPDSMVRYRSRLMPLEDLVEKFSEVAEKPIGDYTDAQRDSMRNMKSDDPRSNIDAYLKSLVTKPEVKKERPRITNLQRSFLKDYEDNRPTDHLVEFHPEEFESEYDSNQPMYTIMFKAANGPTGWNVLTLPEEKLNLLLKKINEQSWGGVRVAITFHNNDFFSGNDWGYVAEFNDSKQPFEVSKEVFGGVVQKKMGSERIKEKGFYNDEMKNFYAFRGNGGEKSRLQNYMISGKIKSIHSAKKPISARKPVLN
ncbi:MAG: hypothetical protein AABX93_02075 [Nanoarchaeota archaeon]